MQANKRSKANRQSKTVDVRRGLLLVRYATAESESRPPKVRISVNPKDAKHVELILNPDYQEAWLYQPGSCLVARATRPGQILVDVIPADENGSTAATVQLEMLSQGEIGLPHHEHVGASRGYDASGDLTLCCHVAGIGDVHAGAAEWIAGPSAPARIEGLQLIWPGAPAGLDVRYSVKLARPHPVSLKTIELGGYAGTRGQAIPIVGIAVELSGPMAAHYQIAAEATFLGGPVKRNVGREVKLTGVTGGEPLVGFRIRIDQVDAHITPGAKPAGKIRVFRSRSGQSEAESSSDRVTLGQMSARPDDLASRRFG